MKQLLFALCLAGAFPEALAADPVPQVAGPAQDAATAPRPGSFHRLLDELTAQRQQRSRAAQHARSRR